MKRLQYIIGWILSITVIGVYYLPILHAASMEWGTHESMCAVHCMEESIASDRQYDDCLSPQDISDLPKPELLNEESIEHPYLYQTRKKCTEMQNGYISLVGIIKSLN